MSFSCKFYCDVKQCCKLGVKPDRMRILLICVVLFAAICCRGQAPYPKSILQKSQRIINLIEENEIDSLANLMPYPFRNGYFKLISNKAEFVHDYKSFFDSLSIVFKKSKVSINDTTLYFLGGHLYLLGLFTLCDEGTIQTVLISTHNLPAERAAWVVEDTLHLYPKLRSILQNNVRCSTDSFLLRLDMTEAGMRLTLWERNKSMLQKPTVMAYTNAASGGLGSLGLYTYAFIEGTATYKIYNKLTCGKNNGEELWLSVAKPNMPVKKYRCKDLIY